MSDRQSVVQGERGVDGGGRIVEQQMHEAGAGNLKMQLCTKDGQPMFALVLIQGEDTQALLDAMEAKADALEAVTAAGGAA